MSKGLSSFSTSDAALAAWLFINNIELLDTVTESFPSKFIFQDHNNEISKLVESFRKGEAIGNIIAYDRAKQIMTAKARGK